jgi:uncharacterized protein (DUF1330 family)
MVIIGGLRVQWHCPGGSVIQVMLRSDMRKKGHCSSMCYGTTLACQQYQYNITKILAGAGSAMERLEGNRELPSVLFILEFPSLEQAKAWYNDPEYVQMIHLRQTGADAHIIVVEGL